MLQNLLQKTGGQDGRSDDNVDNNDNNVDDDDASGHKNDDNAERQR